MKATFLETAHGYHAFPSGIVAANEHIFNGDPASDVINMKNADTAVFLIVTNANGSSGTAAVTVLACDDTTPTNTSAVPFYYRKISAPDTQGAVTAATTSGFTTTGTANDCWLVEVDSADIHAANSNAGYGYVQCVCTEDTNQPVDGAMFAFLMKRRYQDDTTAQSS